VERLFEKTLGVGQTSSGRSKMTIDVFLEGLGMAWFLAVGICGCLYPFLIDRDKHKPFHKSQNMYCDGDNT